MPEPVSKIILRALSLIERESPQAYTSITDELDGLVLTVRFDDTLCLECKDSAIYQSDSSFGVDIQVVAKRAAVIAVIRGQSTFSDSLRSGEIEIIGAIESLVKGLTAVEYFIGALLRIRSADNLLTALES